MTVFNILKGKLRKNQEILMNRQQFIGLTLTGLVSIMSLGTLSRGSAWGQTSMDQATLRNSVNYFFLGEV
ncbi:MAG: hypothetical protein EAZ68_03115 [Oscillatoriales cyanobacterium]|nr:MAG: hypothetical protein EAZ96_03025 [Oscillatoriales cyanobacterium]TAF46817.1 MAG: hypothetical protein EAZ68_03115 [Oscillatoriales cyanobacterium]